MGIAYHRGRLLTCNAELRLPSPITAVNEEGRTTYIRRIVLSLTRRDDGSWRTDGAKVSASVYADPNHYYYRPVEGLTGRERLDAAIDGIIRTVTEDTEERESAATPVA